MGKKTKVSTKEFLERLEKEGNKNWDIDQYNNFVSREFSRKRRLNEKSLIKDEKFIFDEKDSKFVSSEQSIWNSITTNFMRNFSVFGKIFSKKFFSSGTLLIFMVIPLILNILFTDEFISLTVFEDKLKQVDYIRNFSQSFIFPVLCITIIFIPSFITSLRSESLIKRLGVYGISREQFNIVITLLTLIFSIIIAFFVFFPLTLLGHVITESIFNSEIIWKPISVNWGILIPLFILMTISFTQIGLLLGMKYKTAKYSSLLGYLFTFLISLFTNYQQGGFAELSGSLSMNIIYDIFRWIFLITPITIVIQGVVLCSSNNPINSEWRDWVIPLSYILSLVMFIIPFFFTRKWLKFKEIK